MALMGANVSQLRELGRAASEGSESLARIQVQLQGLIATPSWRGTDAERFRTEWDSTLAPALRSASRGLSSAAATLGRHADEQEHASAAHGGTTHRPTSSTPSHPGETRCPEGECRVPGPWGDAVGVLSSDPATWAAWVASAGGLVAETVLFDMQLKGLVQFSQGMYSVAPGSGYHAVAGPGLQSLNAVRLLGNAAGAVSAATSLLAAGQDIYCGDYYSAADNAIGGTLTTLALVTPPPASLALGGASLVWTGLDMACDHFFDKDVTEVVVDGLSSAWNWLSGG